MQDGNQTSMGLPNGYTMLSSSRDHGTAKPYSSLALADMRIDSLSEDLSSATQTRYGLRPRRDLERRRNRY